jgi:hypothetical protein
MYTGQRERRKMERFCFTYLHNSELCFKSAKVTLGQSKKQQAHFWRESGSREREGWQRKKNCWLERKSHLPSD